MPPGHFTCARRAVPVLAAALVASLATSVQGQTSTGTASFTIFVGARPVGTEQVQLQRTDQGWTISSSGRVGAPVDLILRQLEARYDSEWRPLGLRVDTTVRGRSLTIRSTVDGTAVTNETTPLGAAPVEQKGTIDELGIFVVNPVVAPFEAVAARLKSATSGTTLSLYRPGQGSSSATVGESSVERIKTLHRM